MSKPVHSGIVDQEADAARRSARASAQLRGVASRAERQDQHAGDDRHQIARLRSGQDSHSSVLPCALFCQRDASTEPRSGAADDAEDHRERVVVDVAGLQAADDAGEPADHARRCR